MEKKKEYQHPAVEVVEFKSKVQLMQSSDPTPGSGGEHLKFSLRSNLGGIQI
jgi:hypothetical protein